MHTPPYHCLMKNLDIYSPGSSFSITSSCVGSKSTRTRQSACFLAPKPKQQQELPTALSTTRMASVACGMPLKPPKEQSKMVMFDTPTRSNANIEMQTKLELSPRKRAFSFDHHQGSPFTAFGPVFGKNQGPHDRGTANKQFTPSATNEGGNIINYSPSLRRTPIKFVTQNDAASETYDPSTIGSYMTKSPLVKSIDSVMNNKQELEDPEVKYYNSMKPIESGPTIISLSTQRQKHLLPAGVKLTPKTSLCKRSLDKQVVAAQSSAMGIDSCPSRIKLTPKSIGLQTSPPVLSLPGPMMADADPIVSMVLQFNASDSKKDSHAQGIKHFPRIPKITQKKSRSLLNPKSSYDSIQSLLQADAVVEAARANEPLTDDEDSDIESDPDYMLCCPSSVAKNGSRFAPMPKWTPCNSSAQMMTADDDGLSTENRSFLRSSSLASTLSLFGTEYSKENVHDQVVDDKASYCNSVSIDTDPCKRSNSIFSLFFSDDSEQVVAQRELFTPPPFLGKDEGFRALSPPTLCSKQAKV